MSGVSEVTKSTYPIDFTANPTYDQVYETLKKEYEADLGTIEKSLENAGSLRNLVDYQIRCLNNKDLILDESKVEGFQKTATEKFDEISMYNEQLTSLKTQLGGAIAYLQGLKPINVDDVARYNKAEAERIKEEQTKVKPALEQIKQWYYKIDALDATFKERFAVLKRNIDTAPASISYHFPKPQPSLVDSFKNWWSSPQKVDDPEKKEETTAKVEDSEKKEETKETAAKVETTTPKELPKTPVKDDKQPKKKDK